MDNFKKIVITGAGFMGTSLALDIKKTKTAEHVCALVRSKERAMEIKKSNFFDFVTHLWHEAFLNADLIVLATPITVICSQLIEIESYLSDNPDITSPITDIGSIKMKISEQAKKLKNVSKCFIGAHPLCGSEKSGMQNSFAGLYEGCSLYFNFEKKSKIF